MAANPAKYIIPLNMNGLEGRMLHMPSKKKDKHELLFIYGHHSSLERWWGLIQVLHEFGTVTMPDLPGFGGMDSFYKIGKEPSIDNLADYLASFIKMQYRHKKFILVGMSYGFVVVTRMLQRYPELTKNIKMLVSLVGFADHDDFTFSKPRYYFYLYGTRFFEHKIPSFVFRHLALNSYVLKAVYSRTHNAKNKFKDATTKKDHDRLMDVEVKLWQDNDVRTWMYTTTEFLLFSNCDRQVDLPVWHVSAQADHFFDNSRVEQHMRVIFTDFHGVNINMTNHAPTVIAGKKEAAALVPKELKQYLKDLK